MKAVFDKASTLFRPLYVGPKFGWIRHRLSIKPHVIKFKASCLFLKSVFSSSDSNHHWTSTQQTYDTGLESVGSTSETALTG